MAPKWFRRFSSSSTGNSSNSRAATKTTLPASSNVQQNRSASMYVPNYLDDNLPGSDVQRRFSSVCGTEPIPLTQPGNRPFSIYSTTSSGPGTDASGSSLPTTLTPAFLGTSPTVEVQTDRLDFGYTVNELEIFKLECERKVTKAQDELKCIICLHNERSVMFSPCHHVITCGDCARELPFQSSLTGGYQVCPLCRKTIAKLTKVYLS